eukprot:scaffold26604_cov116-Isochrysis_galbana.AAC.6
MALAWANGQSSPLLAREKCAAKTLMSAAAPPFTTTASAVHYNPLRRIKPTLEQFVAAFKRSLPKNLEPLTPRALTISTLCIRQIVPQCTPTHSRPLPKNWLEKSLRATRPTLTLKDGHVPASPHRAP